MSTYILDTGIVLGYVHGAGYAEYVERHFSVFLPPNVAVISVVTIGEIYSLSLQLGWGEAKRDKLKDVLSKIPSIDISHQQIIEKYAEIDAYSQGKHPSLRLPQGVSSRNMGKNDIWIAATGAVLKGVLLTTDQDFDHLCSVFLKVEYIDQSLKGTDARV